MSQRLSISLLLICFSIRSLALQASQETQNFSLKSLTDPHIDNYSPLRISLELDESIIQDTQLNNAVKAAADATVKILSDLVLSKPSKDGFKFGEKIQCESFLLHQIIKSQRVDADFGLYITSSNDSKDDLLTIKKCENDSQLFVVSIAINPKKFLVHENISQIKKLSSAISGIIFEDNLYKNQLLSEIEDYIEHLPKLSAAISCPDGEFNDNGVCVACPVNCQTCNSENGDCTSCWPGMDQNCNCPTDNIFNVNTHTCIYCPNQICICPDPQIWSPGTQSCVNCPTGQYGNGWQCLECDSTCLACSNNLTCSSCYTGMKLLPNLDCVCNQPDQVFNSTSNTCVWPNGRFESNGACSSCQSTCFTCSSASGCTQCYQGMHLLPNSSCVCDDPLKMFDLKAETCVDCENSENGCTNNCAKGCNLCFNSQMCQTCYDPENMVNKNGVCSCTDDNQNFSVSEKKCVDNSSANGLILVWILVLYAAI